ncbi:MAG: NUDIX hydrolase [Desulfovibrionaceae bacterium]|nr:NUDIX hydrolase [Desulfovibrionaceae bacterium]
MSVRAKINCPGCGREIQVYKSPAPTVDIVLFDDKRGILLIERRFEPLGWALPGGFVDYGEQLDHCAVREMKEETNLDVTVKKLVGVYSNPIRDPRRHSITTAFWCECSELDRLQAGDDAGKARFFQLEELPEDIVFDHRIIIEDFLKIYREGADAAWR